MIGSTRTFGVASLVVIAAVALARPARAESHNQIRAITLAEDGATTKVRIAGSEVATFTVYKLERPSRVVLDVARAELADEMRGHEAGVSLAANTWAVGTVVAQPLVDGGSGVRVIVALARPGRYDVKIEGKDLVVLVTARDAAPASSAGSASSAAEMARAQAQAQAAQRESEAARAEAAQAKASASAQAAAAQKALSSAEQSKIAAETARSKAEQDAAAAKKSATAAQDEAERLRAVAAAQAKRAAEAEQLAASAQQRDRKREEAAAAARAQAAKAEQEAAAAKAQAVAAQREAERTRTAAEKVQRESQVELDKARREIAAAQQKLAAERAAVEAERKQVSARAAELERASGDTARLRAEAEASRAAARSESEAAQRAVAAARSEAEATAVARREVEAARKDAARARAEAEEAQRAVAAARSEADKLRTAAEQKLEDANAKLSAASAQLAALDQQTAAARKLREDAQLADQQAAARQKAARQAEAAAAAARLAAKAEAERAAAARDQAMAQADSKAQSVTAAVRAEREQLIAEAKAAEARLAEMTRSAKAAEAQRREAERAAAAAREELEAQRKALASLETQRKGTEDKIRDASTRQARAEAAAASAGERRQKAESEAQTAEKQRAVAEAAAKQAAAQQLAAETARRAAEEQRVAAEAASRAAETQRQASERALTELSSRRAAAERAAEELEARRLAASSAKAKADDADRQKASKAQQAKTKAEAERLAAAKQRAEQELRERTAAVDAQAKEVERLKRAAAAARDEAAREEHRRTQLAERRAAEERELERLRKQVAQTQVAPPAASSPAFASSSTGARPSAAPVALTAMAPAKLTPAAAPAKPAAKPAKPAATPATPAATVTDISFHADDEAPRIDIAIRGDAKVRTGELTDRRAELILDDAELADQLERKLDVTRFGGALRSISSYRDRKVAGRVHLVVDFSSPITPTLQRKGNVLGWKFASSQVAGRGARSAPRTIPTPVIGGFGSTSAPISQQTVTQVSGQVSGQPSSGGNRRRKVYRGPTVELDFKEAPIHDLLRLLSDVGKVNIVVPDEVDAKVTVRMKRVPWDQALEVILASKGLWYRQEGNLIRVAQRKALDEEDEAEAARRAAAVQSESPRPDVITLNYASSEQLKTKLAPLLSPKGKIETDERTNALIVNDVRANREEIRALALQLDTQTPQISIEARIVEARSTFVRDIGVQWGGRAVAGPDGGNSTGLLFPSSVAVAGGAEDTATVRSGVATPSDFAVNLPAAVGSGAGGALGFSLGSIGGNYNINLRLSALESNGSVRIVSAPKITVLNNTEAKISQGVSIPIQVLSSEGTNTVFVPADLSLTVKPYVSLRDCAIAMELNVTKNEPDFVNTGARGDPTILRKEARTTLLVNDGETSVLGGIYTRNAGLSYSKVPFFGDLPVLGWLFKNRKENDSRTEVLVFITPKITNKAFLRCQGTGN